MDLEVGQNLIKVTLGTNHLGVQAGQCSKLVPQGFLQSYISQMICRGYFLINYRILKYELLEHLFTQHVC